MIIILLLYYAIYNCYAFIKSLFKTKYLTCENNKILCYQFNKSLDYIKYTFILIACIIISYLSIISYEETTKLFNKFFD